MLDAEGRPTGRTELKFGKDGEAGYLKWLAANHPAVFGALYGKLIPLDPRKGSSFRLGLGLTTRRHSSGEVDWSGSPSRRLVGAHRGWRWR